MITQQKHVNPVTPVTTETQVSRMLPDYLEALARGEYTRTCEMAGIPVAVRIALGALAWNLRQDANVAPSKTTWKVHLGPLPSGDNQADEPHPYEYEGCDWEHHTDGSATLTTDNPDAIDEIESDLQRDSLVLRWERT